MRFFFQILLLVICLILISCTDSKPNDIAFNSNAWKGGNARLRGQMYHDLRERKVLIGMSRGQVIEILGPADHDERKFVAYEVDNGHILNKIAVSRVHMVVVFDDFGAIVTSTGAVDR